jgi:ribitol 2-dehydrogenase
MSLRDEVVLITGGSSGIGRSMARSMAAAGAKVMITGRSEDRLKALVDEVGGEHAYFVADVASAEAATAQVDAAISRFGQLDVVVANAGVYADGNTWEGDPAQFTQLIATNVTGLIHTINAAIPHMITRDFGDIVATSSISGHKPIYWEPVYSASKHAVQSFVHGLRRQLIKTNIRVMSVAPGRTLNELWGITDPAEIADIIEKREGLTSEDVAEALLFMLTRPRHVTVRDLVMLPSNQDL